MLRHDRPAQSYQRSRGTLSLDGTGQQVTIESQQAGTTTRLFVVTGGSLVLTDLGVPDASVVGTNGKQGSDGANGANGANALPPGPGSGTPGVDGTSGTKGRNGKPAQGGAMYIGPQAAVVLRGCTFENDSARGGSGGQGGGGGNGAGGGAGADGGAGGAAEGGAIYNLGNLTIMGSTFEYDDAMGGSGGAGEVAGGGGSGGNGGAGATGFQGTNFGGTGGAGGPAGTGADGGDAGNGGGGGPAVGGAIYSAGVLTLDGGVFERTIAGGGAGGEAGHCFCSGGNGGSGGRGGTGGSPKVAGPGGKSGAGIAGGLEGPVGTPALPATGDQDWAGPSIPRACRGLSSERHVQVVLPPGQVRAWPGVGPSRGR